MNPVDLLIKNAKVYAEAGFQDLDVAAMGEKIAFLSKPGSIPDGKKTIDARGKYVLPGMIDFHCHLREPGLTQKEDFETGTMSEISITFWEKGIRWRNPARSWVRSSPMEKMWPRT